jgi:hypothetical protein
MIKIFKFHDLFFEVKLSHKRKANKCTATNKIKANVNSEVAIFSVIRITKDIW